MPTTRQKIIIGAVSLFVEQGIARTTTREIAANSRVAEGSIYRYFPSKEELAWQIFRDYQHYLANCLQEAVTEKQTIVARITALVNCFLRLADEDWLMFQYYLTAQHTYMRRVDPDQTTPYTIIIDCIQQAMKNNEIQYHDPHILAAMAMGSVQQVAINKIYKRIRGDLLRHGEEISQAVCRIVQSSQQEIS